MANLLLGIALRTAGKLTIPMLLFGISLGRLFAQEVQQSARAVRNLGEILGMTPDESGKCGTTAILRAHSQMNQLASDTRNKVVHILQRTERQKSRLSPSGKFRIHYDTTGADAPALITPGSNAQRIPNTVERYVDSVAFWFDYAWKLEVDTLGYPAPPGDGSQGGGPEYDVYVQDFGSGTFGLTNWESIDLIEDGPRQRYTTYIEIENDFLGYRTPGIDGLRITAAHEFFHAIQVGDYGVWTIVPSLDSWFLELSSVWMEHVAFPGIHDYWFDAPNYFQRFRGALNQSLAFNSLTYGGYERAVWALFLEKRFGKGIMKDIWTGLKSAPPLGCMAAVLSHYGTSFEAEYALFSSWNFFTADRADPAKYYDEGQYYPRYTPNVNAAFTGLTASVSSAAPPLSTQFYQVALTSDTIVAVIANVDVRGAQDPNSVKASLQLNLSATDLQPPYQKVARGLGMTFTASDMQKWRALYLLASSKANANVAPDPSPNPVRLAQDVKLVLPVQGATQDQAEIFLLNAAVELVYSRQYPVRRVFGNSYIDVPSADLRGSVPTGVYFVVARCGDYEYKWKVAIIQ
jgi:hypothetical protein